MSVIRNKDVTENISNHVSNNNEICKTFSQNKNEIGMYKFFKVVKSARLDSNSSEVILLYEGIMARSVLNDKVVSSYKKLIYTGVLTTSVKCLFKKHGFGDLKFACVLGDKFRKCVLT